MFLAGLCIAPVVLANNPENKYNYLPPLLEKLLIKQITCEKN
jgi:hypothetical protein